MTSTMRRVIAGVIAVGAVWLLVVRLPAAAAALRSRSALVSACNDISAAAPAGTWVRLEGCGVSGFYHSFLADDTGRKTRRLVPLWWIDAEGRKAHEPSYGSVRLIPNPPSRVALAVPIAPQSDEETYRVKVNAGLYPDGLDPLVTTMGVIVGKTGTPTHRVVEVPGSESGLAESAVVIDLRVPPDLRSALWHSGLGLAMLLLAAFLFTRELPMLPEIATRPLPMPGRLASAGPGSSEVKWGRVLVFTLVGIAVLFRGVVWYFDPVRASGALVNARAGPAAKVSEPAGRAPRSVSPASPDEDEKESELPEPTPEEIALLRSADTSNQLKGIELLNARAVTPELVSAVEVALGHPATPEIQAKLVCLQTRFDTPDSLDRLIARFPRDRRSLDWNLPADVACTLNALARRAAEDPERVRDALMPAVFASNLTTRQKVLSAFRTLDLPQLPPALVAEASAGGGFSREAIAAALALGAVRLNPDLVVTAAHDSSANTVVVHELKRDESDDAVRLLARVWTEVPSNPTIERFALERERQRHDVSSALLEIVLDSSRADAQRQAAASRLATLPEIGPLAPLRELSAGLVSGGLKTVVDDTIAALEARQQKQPGRVPQMRALF